MDSISALRRGSLRLVHARSGFTLIELMIVVAVIAILVAIAYPSYQAYTVRSNRAAAQSVLMDIAQREQQFLLDQRSYATGIQTGTSASPLADWQTTLNYGPLPTNVTSVYTITVSIGATPISFTAAAAPIAGTVQASRDTCGTLKIDQAGNKTVSMSGTSCW